MVDFGKRLKKLRTNAGMTQAKLANHLGVTKSVVSYYELHERTPSPEILVKLSNIFRVSSDYLLGIEHSKTINVSDLSDEDIEFIILTIETLKRKKEN